MDNQTRHQLHQLKTIVSTPGESQIPQWIREKLVEIVTHLLETDAPLTKIKNELIGACKAIGDQAYLEIDDHDPALTMMISIIDSA